MYIITSQQSGGYKYFNILDFRSSIAMLTGGCMEMCLPLKKMVSHTVYIYMYRYSIYILPHKNMAMISSPAKDVLLANGTVVSCSRTEHPELFAALPHSYGTLGYVPWQRCSFKVSVTPQFFKFGHPRFCQGESTCELCGGYIYIYICIIIYIYICIHMYYNIYIYV